MDKITEGSGSDLESRIYLTGRDQGQTLKAEYT
jgi:hypothetical protein